MKRMLIAGAALCFAALATAGADDVWQQLQVKKSEVGPEIVGSFVHGGVNTGAVRNAFRSASPGLRAQLVEQVLVWTKAYVASDQFARQYAAMREEAKPRLEEEDEELSVDEELARRRKERLDDLERTRQSIAGMPAEYRKAAEEGYEAAVAAMKQLDTEEFRELEKQGIEMQREAREEARVQDLADWEETWPSDPKDLVRTRLEEFLEATEDVDFEAETVKRYGKDVFVDAAYESKPAEWKLAYRAGRPAVEKARAFARTWLAELN